MFFAIKRKFEALKGIRLRSLVRSGGFVAKMSIESTKRRLFYSLGKIGNNHMSFLDRGLGFVSPWLMELLSQKE